MSDTVIVLLVGFIWLTGVLLGVLTVGALEAAENRDLTAFIVLSATGFLMLVAAVATAIILIGGLA
jgi:hypothetical protein